MTVSLENYSKFVAAGNSHVKHDEVGSDVNGGAGMVIEASEVLDILRRKIVLGKPVDRVHLVEEMGDTFWYFVQVMNQNGLSLTEIIDANVEKLCKRHPRWYGDDHEVWHDLPG